MPFVNVDKNMMIIAVVICIALICYLVDYRIKMVVSTELKKRDEIKRKKMIKMKKIQEQKKQKQQTLYRMQKYLPIL